MVFDHAMEVGFEIFLAFFGGDGAVDGVLPDENAFGVAVVVPEIGFDFDVFADHVKAEFEGEVDVPGEGFGGGGGVDAVGPESLVEEAELKDFVAVEEDAIKITDFADFDVAEAEVCVDRIEDLVAQAESGFDFIEVGIIGGPELGIAEFHVGFFVGGDGEDGLVFAFDDDFHLAAVSGGEGLGFDINRAGGGVGGEGDPAQGTAF